MSNQLLALKPDLEGLRRNLLREATPSRVFFFEHGIAANVKDALAQRCGVPLPGQDSPRAVWDFELALQRRLGFEVFRVWLPGAEYKVAGSLGIAWGEEHAGPIQTWDDVQRYDWPDPSAVDFSQMEYYEANLPEDMGVFHCVKLWEVVRELLGLESFCLKMFEQPELVAEVIGRVGRFHVALVEALCDFRATFAVYAADDFGYKTGTMMAPQYIIENFLPWHQRMAEIAHRKGKLYFLHSCGKVDSLMDHLIDVVAIDAKHSFEETVVPVTEAKRRWGGRVALLGGLDIDFVARRDPVQIRQLVRKTLEVCQPGGGYCLGLGNWVTDYIPPENYLAVLDEGRRFRLE